METDVSGPGQRAERIGPYRILQVLGEGGMGIVYEAEETDSVRRRVALKVVRDRHASKEVLARFEVERQALAVMNHPAIAKVFAAGTTPDGQPYFAMELVRGLPFTQYCDEHRLSVRERLELFIAVCHGVQHAHQKGVIHRDIKPSNILVTEADGVPEPRIIDFGIAKALGQQLTDLTLITQFGHAVGTAAYMSPEQAESNGADIDTRSDVYSLGVLMYEMLVGELPSDPGTMGLHAYLARLMARETDPPTPSDRIGSTSLDPTIVAKARSTDLPRLQRDLRGDLDWIVMKAMDPDRNRRYVTANALAVDLQRYLSNEPITARPPTAMYRLGKLVRRNRIATIGAALGLVAILAGAAFSTVGMVRARRAEHVAAQEAAAARQVTDFLINIFNISNPN
ncbi:MAG: serine/threonine protein kinase, partial [Gemmatimonadaceae bacterium]|nr:serine/threonine protein kinase [Gemmatimonadaceae bacterium]